MNRKRHDKDKGKTGAKEKKKNEIRRKNRNGDERERRRKREMTVEKTRDEKRRRAQQLHRPLQRIESQLCIQIMHIVCDCKMPVKIEPKVHILMMLLI